MHNSGTEAKTRPLLHPMSKPADPLTIGQLMIEDTSLDKKITRLRDSARTIAWTFARAARLLNAEPEKFFFVGDPDIDDFAGEKPIERGDLDAGSLRALLTELRMAIIDKKKLRERLAEQGLDLEAIESEDLARKSRALKFPALDDGESGARRKKAMGFAARTDARRGDRKEQ